MEWYWERNGLVLAVRSTHRTKVTSNEHLESVY